MNKEEKEILSQQALEKSVEALDKAHKFAEENRDIEALVVIAERWATFGNKVRSFDKNIKGMIGFYTDGDDEKESENE